jgi:hypothetical protein
METTKIKIKIDQHEFEAEGPTEIVQSQFKDFQELIAALKEQKNITAATTQKQEESFTLQPPVAPPSVYDRIMSVEGRIVSLTVQAPSESDAVLLLMLGQRTFRSNGTVTGGQIMEGLQQSGVIVPRVDRIMDRLASEGMVIRIGVHRATRYRFTNQGFTKAQEIANAAIASVA